MTELKGSCFKLRSWQNTDGPFLQKYANNVNVAAFLGERFPCPYTEDDASWWIKLQSVQPEPTANFALTIDEKAVGGIGIELQNDIYLKNAKLGYWLGEPFWGKGIMTEAVKLFSNYVFENFDIERIYAGVFGGNPASAKVLQKAGFCHEGVFKKSLFKKGLFDDELIYAKLRSA